jgi:hypothetical protein
MNLKLLRIQSEDLEPSDSGYPSDWVEFDVKMVVDLCFEGHEADSVFFEFYVASPIALTKRKENSFMPPTLVLKEFDWSVIKNHVAKLLMHVNGSRQWSEVAVKLSGLMRPSSLSCFPW